VTNLNDRKRPHAFRIARRDFLRGATVSTLAVFLHSRTARADDQPKHSTIEEVRAKTVRYIESMRLRDKPFGRYRFAAGIAEPTLYSSSYAAMTRGLYRDLDRLSTTERSEWIEYLQSHQEKDGLYADPRIAGVGWYKDDPEWCGRRHLTCHVVSALRCLGAVAARPFGCLDVFYDRMHLVKWLEARDWAQKADFAGNEVLNIGTLLQYARDFHREPRAAVAVRTLLQWLSGHYVHADTGLWGGFDTSNSQGLSRAVQAAYHFWLLFFYDRISIPHPKRAVDHLLRSQNPSGSFGWGVHGSNSSACEDIDSIDPLIRLMLTSDYRKPEIRQALCRALPQVLANQNEDGGFVFVRGDALDYGHPLLSSVRDGSAMFPTWFRTLSLAYVGKALPESSVGRFQWDFRNCPGIQFWLTDGANVGEKNS
jgi:hypothetical protein